MTRTTLPAPDLGLSRLDSALLNILVKDGRASFADLARQLGISRAHARARVQALQASGIELFAAVINPEKLGQVLGFFVAEAYSSLGIKRPMRQAPEHWIGIERRRSSWICSPRARSR